jgi:hypothetical protein
MFTQTLGRAGFNTLANRCFRSLNSSKSSRIGLMHLVQSRTDEAIVWFEKARRAIPAHPNARAALASAYALKGDTQRAAAELAEAKRLVGDDRYSSVAHSKAVGFYGATAAGYWGVPKSRALFETTYFAGLRRPECQRNDRHCRFRRDPGLHLPPLTKLRLCDRARTLRALIAPWDATLQIDRTAQSHGCSMCKHRRGTAARRHITMNGHPAGGAARLTAPQGVLAAPSLLRAGLPPLTSRKSRSTCSAPARVSRPRWSAKWKTSPRRAPSASPAPRPSPRPAPIHKCVDHLMIYDAFAHRRSRARRFGLCAARRGRPIRSPSATLPRRQAAAQHQWRSFLRVQHIRPAEERAQVRESATAQIPGAKISVCHGVGGMFAASGTIIIMSNDGP